jgi:hypothetical protein
MLTGRRRALLLAGGLLAGLLLLGMCTLRGGAGPDRSPVRDDPADARNLTVTLIVTPDQIGLVSATVGTGVAANRATEGGTLRVRALDGNGREVGALTIPDPLRRHVYPPADQTSDAPAHTTSRMPGATVTLFLPLDPHTSGIEVGWPSRSPQRFDLVTAIRSGCRDDQHRDCAAWRARHR